MASSKHRYRAKQNSLKTFTLSGSQNAILLSVLQSAALIIELCLRKVLKEYKLPFFLSTTSNKKSLPKIIHSLSQGCSGCSSKIATKIKQWKPRIN